LTYFAISHDSIVVFYNRENDKTSRVEIAKSKDLFKNAMKNFNLLSLLKNSTQSLDNLSSNLNLSKSTISRRVRVLKSAYLVETKYLDKKMLVYISETGLKLLGAKSMLMPS
jgi:DNA-binding transcriptional ArsR family regulator